MKLPQNRVWVLVLGVMAGFLLFCIAALVISNESDPNFTFSPLAYSELLVQIQAGTVADATITGQDCQWMTKDGRMEETYLPADQTEIVNKLISAGARVEFQDPKSANPFLKILVGWLPLLFYALAFRFVGVLVIPRGQRRAEARIAGLEERLAVLEGAR